MQSDPQMTVPSDLSSTDTLAVVEVPVAPHRLRRILLIIGVAVVTLVVAGFLGLLVATRSFVAGGRIAPGVTIAGLDVEGMTAEEALGALEAQWVPTLPEVIKVTFPEGEWEAHRAELGVSLRLEDAVATALRVGREGGLLAQMRARLSRPRPAVAIPVAVEIDDDTLEDAVSGLSDVVERKPVNADIRVAGGEIEVIPGEVGRELDVEATMAAIREALADPTVTEVAAVVKTRMPAVTAEDLSHIEVVLGSYSTPYNADRADRTHNLRLAAGKINKTVLHPGEEFSFNRIVGERGIQAGYREAPIFVDGEVRPSTGGGICQIATTMYNAALLANLDMVERHHHSRPVDYAPTGRDATVYWGQYDLRFRNSLKHPILILASVGSSEVTISILGSRADDAKVEITREGLTRIPYETKEQPDPELEKGKRKVEKPGREGWRVTVYRKATRGGEVIREEKLHTDYYAPQTEVVRVGAKPPAEPTSPPAEARPEATNRPQAPHAAQTPAGE